MVPVDTSPAQLCRRLSRHLSSVCQVPVTTVDHGSRQILLTENCGNNFFCEKCPNRCRLLSTMLYGCNEARRWNGRYVYYCPIGLVYSAVNVPETEYTVLIGPVIMGELPDTLLDLPDSISREDISTLHICSAQMLSHMTSLLEMAVFGLRYRPDAAAYDSNTLPQSGDTPRRESSYISSPPMEKLAGQLADAVDSHDKPKAREIINQLLRYVYAPHPDQLPLIRSRAVQLLYMLCDISSRREGTEALCDACRKIYIPTLEKAASMEAVDETLNQALHSFIGYSFDFVQVDHSNTVYRVMEYIKSNFSRKITLEQVAACACLSSSHISGLFKKETGITISAYITHVRIEKSKLLLRRPELTIAEVASMCGFEEQSYFTRVFKSQTGISPRKYRENPALSPTIQTKE